MSVRTLAAAVAVAVSLSVPARAQDRPFVFSVATTPAPRGTSVLVDYDLGVGDSTFQSTSVDGAEQRIGVMATVGRWILSGRVGLAPVDAAYHTSQQAEVLYALLRQADHGVTMAVGGGMLHEAGGANVGLARLTVGREFARWRAHGNLLLQKPFADNRDAVDLVTSVGWAWRATDTFAIGVEGIGEDLEGFWESEEAEGGARLLVGPSLHLAPANGRWQFSLAGGPMFHPKDTGLSSAAVRDLPALSHSRGFAVRTSFACRF
jgi:hypothetical protein